MFINLRRLALEKGPFDLSVFCEEVLKVYDKHGMNGHIDWTD